MTQRPQISLLSVGFIRFIPAGARLAATNKPNASREAVEGLACFANKLRRDRNSLRSQISESRRLQRPQISLLSVGFVPAGARLAATNKPNASREAVEGLACFANKLRRDRNSLRSQISESRRLQRPQPENQRGQPGLYPSVSLFVTFRTFL